MHAEGETWVPPVRALSGRGEKSLTGARESRSIFSPGAPDLLSQTFANDNESIGSQAKTCRRCGETKGADEFRRNPRCRTV